MIYNKDIAKTASSNKLLPFQVTIDTKLSDVSGIVKFTSDTLQKKGIKHGRDLLWQFPKDCIDAECLASVSENHVNTIIALNLIVENIHWYSNKVNQPSKTMVYCKTLKGQKVAVFFMNLNRTFQNFKEICVYGTLRKNGVPLNNINHIGSDLNKDLDDVYHFHILPNESLIMVRPMWKPYHNKRYTSVSYKVPCVTDGLVHKIILGTINNIKLDEIISKEEMQKRKWFSFLDSLRIMHSHLTDKKKAKERLKFDEALVYEYGIYNAWQDLQKTNAEFVIKESDVSELVKNFGANLTDDQLKCFNEIKSDLISNYKMMRILYGDVGSGKTLVAFLALLMTYKSNRQAAILVPTGILAKQHYELISKLLPNAKIVFLTGSQKTKNALKIIENENCIIVGTHALLQSKVKYKNLGLLVVDEQHRFGVLQRMLVDKGMQYNVLLMTATPIPRTLKLSFMGYIPVSKILTRPQNHKDIKTEICSMSHIEQLIDSVKNAIENEDSVFWVCPNIEEENKRGGMSVYTRGKLLEEHFPNLTGILHGKMTENEKDAVLNKFLNKEIKILISTTVIEVGVNIPHANIIIIDNSEYFGMAQLYQLMGRVGRGSRPGLVYLTYGSLSSETKMRLMALKECKQGLDLAEKDMYIRGFGNLLGEEQSGDSTQCFKCLDVFNDAQILIEAREMVHKNINNQAFCEMLDKKSEIFACLKESWTAG